MKLLNRFLFLPHFYFLLIFNNIKTIKALPEIQSKELSFGSKLNLFKSCQVHLMFANRREDNFHIKTQLKSVPEIGRITLIRDKNILKWYRQKTKFSI